MYCDLWAKRIAERETCMEDPGFHPLLFHMLDTAAVSKCLWELVLERGLRASLARLLRLGQEETACWVTFWAGLHDIGKASPAFQGKWEEAKSRLSGLGLKFYPIFTFSPHGFITTAVLSDLLEEMQCNPAIARLIGTAVGGHHGVFARSDDIDRLPSDAIGKGKWNEIRRVLFKEFANRCQVADLPIPRCDLNNAFLVLLAGLTSVSDWIASNQEFFPFARKDTNLEEYVETAASKAENALKNLGWIGWHSPSTLREMTELFTAIRKHGPRPLQSAAAQLSEKLPDPALVIVEAPMGEGKTEAAMYFSDRWAVAFGQRGCYFALPTQATSNQMFGRVKEFLKERYPDDLVNLQLLHGHASLSSEFQMLRTKADHIFSPSGIEGELERESESLTSDIVAAEWFTYRKRGLLAPFGVGTVDQILMSVLQTRHYFIRLFGLSYKTAIIDEVHAYDAYMTTLLERLLEWLAAMNCSVILLSATLPKTRRMAFLKAYKQGLGNEIPTAFPDDSPYPRFTWVSQPSSDTMHVKSSAHVSKTYRFEWVNGIVNPSGFELGEKLHVALSNGGCAAIICNTVARAQEVYRTLKQYFPNPDAGDGNPELDLFHARYPFMERQKRELRSLIRFGKPNSIVDLGEGVSKEVCRPKRAVLVATQVIEQSLDLDFDLMVTDMAPIDLILQRTGRLHRHYRQRPVGLEMPILWITKPITDKLVPQFESGDESVYDRHILLRTWLALEDFDKIAIPEDVETLIEMVYDDRPPWEGLSPKIHDAWEESKKELTNKKATYEFKAKSIRILPPNYDTEDFLEDSNRELEEDNPEVHKSVQALTRLSDPTVPIICLYGTQEKPAFDSENRKPVELDAELDMSMVRSLLSQSLTLSHRGLVPWLLRKGFAPPNLSKNPLLRNHRVIFFEGNNMSRLGKYELRVDPEEGLIVTRMAKGVSDAHLQSR